MKVRVPISGTVGKSVTFDPNAGARAEAAVAALSAQISAGLGANIRHSSLQGLQIGDDHPQYTGNQFPETITGQWNFQTIPFIQGETLAEYIEEVVGGSFFDFLQDTTSVVWTYHDSANELEANVPPEFVQDVVGAMLTDTSTVTLAYNDLAGTIAATVPGAALSRVDDTNVTLTLGGSPLTALARAASLTLGWTGQLAVSRGGSGAATLTGYLKGNGTSAFTASAAIPGSDITGAALTRVDDTNVTLTLGGTPLTALLRASSLTLGWTGTLAVARGGSGAGTLTGYLKGNGTSAFTASATIPYTDISGTPSIPAGANPSASVGLTAVNGSASTFLRSDGAPALSQSIAPTWTGHHQWTSSSRNLLDLTAAGITYGNSTDAPLHTFFGVTLFDDHSIIQHSTSPYLVFRTTSPALDHYLQIASPDFNFSAGSGFGFTVSINGGGSGAPSFGVRTSATANDTRVLLYDVTAGALVRVSRGASDSGGVGFRVLRIPN